MDAALILEGLRLVQEGGVRFEADGTLHTDGSPDPAVSALRLGRGGTIPAPLKAKFPQAKDPPADETALWLMIPAEGEPAAGRPAWLAIFRAAGVTLHGWVPLRADALVPGDLTFGAGAELTVELELAGGAIQRAALRLTGNASLQGALALDGSCDLRAELTGSPPLESILDDPARLLDAEFSGSLALHASTGDFALGAVELGGGMVRAELAVISPAATRWLAVSRIAFALESGAPLSLTGIGPIVADVKLTGTLSDTSASFAELTGTGSLLLPDGLFPALHGLGTARFSVRTTPSSAAVELDAGATLQLDVLGTGAATVHATLNHPGGYWTIEARSESRLSWDDLCARLAGAQLELVPPGVELPDLLATCRVTLVDGGHGAAALSLRPVAAPPAGALPLELHDWYLEVYADLTPDGIGTWRIGGGGTLSTSGWLAEHVPIRALPFRCELTQGRLRFVLESGLPPLALPQLELLTLKQLVLELGDELLVAGTVALPDTAALVAGLDVPPRFAPLLQRCADNLTLVGRFTVAAPLHGGDARVELAVAPSQPRRFALLGMIGELLYPNGVPADENRIKAPDDFFGVTPRALKFSATLGEAAALTLSVALDCVVFGETFDLTLALVGTSDGGELLLAAGTTDPITLTIPMPDTRKLLGQFDVSRIVRDYNLTGAQQAVLFEAYNALVQAAFDIGAQGALALEISNLGLRISDAEPVVSGDVRIVQLPRFVDQLGVLSQITLTLGSSLESVHIAISLDRDAGPLVTIPLPTASGVANNVRVYVGRFMLAYVWGADEFAFALDADVEPALPLEAMVDGTGVIVPGIEARAQVGATATAPPIPLVEAWLRFPPADGLGLQAVLGVPRPRSVVAYVREVGISPSLFLLSPGVFFDGGLLVGDDTKPDELFARFTVDRGTVIFIDPALGVLLNPLALVPPFVTANPPYWFAPPSRMGDVYGSFRAALNVPGLVGFDLRFDKPRPELGLQVLLELVALVAGGFSKRVDPASALGRLFALSLEGSAWLQIPGVTNVGLTLPKTGVNAADFINAAVELKRAVQATLDGGADLLARLRDDPSYLIRLIPRARRSFRFSFVHGGFALADCSAHLLTAEELDEELRIFFENRRLKRRGVAALEPPPQTTTEPTGPAQLVQQTQIVHEWVKDPRQVAPPDHMFINRALTSPEYTRATAMVKSLVEGRHTRTMDSARKLASALLAMREQGPAARASLLNGIGLGWLAGQVEAMLAANAPADVLAQILFSPLLTPAQAVTYSAELGTEPPEAVARRAVAGMFGGWRAAISPDQPLQYRALAPNALPASSLPALRDAIYGWLENSPEFGSGNPDAQRAVAERIHTQVLAWLRDRYHARYVPAPDRGWLEPQPDRVHALVHEALAGWGVPETLVTTDVVRTFDAGAAAGRIRGGVTPADLAPAAIDPTVEEVTGYAIQLRDSTFGVPIATAAAQYMVERRGASYWVLVRGADGRFHAHPEPLPAAVVDALPAMLDKSAALRERLTIAPVTTIRTASAAELAQTAPAYEPCSYLESVLVASEYELKSSGGVHGPFYAADLLRDPGTLAYTVPAGPALVAGMRTKLFQTDVRLCGLVVATAAEPAVLLHGAASVASPPGLPLRLSADGEFTLASGAFRPNRTGVAVDFAGKVALTQDGSPLVSGSARGSFTSGGTAQFDVSFATQGLVDLDIAGLKLLRLRWKLDGNLGVAAGAQFALSAAASAALKAEHATFGTKRVEITPAITLVWRELIYDGMRTYGVIPYPVFHWEERWMTIPAVHIDIPDPTQVSWDPFVEFKSGLSASVVGGRAKLALDIGPLGLGTTTLDLPALL